MKKFLLLLFTMLFAVMNLWAQISPVYVNSAIGNDSWDGSSPTVGTFPIGPKATIQAGIDAVSTAGTVNIAAGTYTQEITITRAMTLLGSDGAILDGSSLGLQKNGVKIKSGDVTFNNIDVINFSGNGIICGYEASIPGNLPNIHITNCLISNIQPGYSHGFGIYIGYEAQGFGNGKLSAHLNYSGLLIENNEITGTKSSALVLQSISSPTGTLLVKNNNIHTNTTNSGIWVDCARNLAIENNIVSGNKWGIEISDITVSDGTIDGPHSPKDLSISGNQVTNSLLEGIVLYSGWPATISVTENIISGNTINAKNVITTAFNASLNWWGSNDPDNVDAGITANIDYTPYLNSGTDLGDPGFQPDLSNLWVDDNSPQLGTTGRIQEGINLVTGSTVNVAAGTYTENIAVNKKVILDGAGNGADPTTNTVINGNGGIAVNITACGTNVSDRLTLQDLYITGGSRGINVSNNASYLKFDHVSTILNTGYGFNFDGALNNEVLITYCKFNQNGVAGVSGVGLRLQSTTKVNNLDIDNSEFNSNYEGIYAGDGGAAFYQANTQLDQINITTSTFDGNTIKGIYVESMNNATFDDITVSSNGCLAAYPHGAGIDINLKYNNYTNISIQNSEFTDNGIGSLNGVGLTVKARDDGGYGTFPASLSNLIIDNVTFIGNKTGLTFGEPGKDNAGPTTPVVKNCTFSTNTNSDINNNCKSNIDALLNNTFTGATDNYAIEDRIFHKLDNSVKGLVNWVANNVYVTTNSGSVQRGIASAGATGWTVNIASGTYTETGNVLISNAVTLLGANSAINPNTGERTAETIWQGNTESGLSSMIELDAENIVIKGFTLNNLRIDNDAWYNLTPDGTNTLLIGGIWLENNIFSNAVGTAIYLRDGRNAPGSYSDNVSIQNNKITAPISAGTDDYSAGSGMVILGAGNSTITGNVITNAAYNGIQLGRCNAMTVSGNTATGAAQPAFQIAQWNAGTNNISGNTFSTLSTTKAAIRIYGITNGYVPTININTNTIKESKYGIQIGHESSGGNDLINANYNFSGNTFSDISADRLRIYLSAAAVSPETTEMNLLFQQTHVAESVSKNISTSPYTYVANTLVVGSGEQYATVGEAIAAAQSGDIILLVTPGNSTGVTIGKNLHIKNTGGGQFTFTGASPALTVTTGTTVTIDGGGTTTYTNATNAPTILVEDGATLNITGCTIVESTGPYDQSGILVEGTGVLNAGTVATPGHNTFISDGFGMAITNENSAYANAKFNYWGSTEYVDIASQITGNVLFDPWCNSNFSSCGFSATIPGPITYAGKVVKSPIGSGIVVPITVDNFTNVNAISLKIKYNPAILTFVNGSDLHSPFSWGTYDPYADEVNGYIYISAISGSGVTFASPGTLLLNLNFESILTGTSLLEWTDSGITCEYQNSITQTPFVDTPFQDFYKNGFVTDMYVTFNRDYVLNKIIAEPHLGSLSYTYAWTGFGSTPQTSTDPYIIPSNGYGTYTVVVTDNVGAQVTATYYYGPVHNIDTKFDFAKIQNAIDTVNTIDGHTITVDPGTFIEQITIQKSLTVIGSGIGNSIIRTPATRTLNVVNGSETWDYLVAAYPGSGTINVKIEGFTLDANNTINSGGTTKLAGLFIRDVSGIGAGLFASEIHNFGSTEYTSWGIATFGNSNLTIDGNTIGDFTRDGFLIKGDYSLNPDPTITITGNTIVGNALALNGINVYGGAVTTISLNNVSGLTRSTPWAGCGIYISVTGSLSAISGNTVTECWDGIAVGYGTDITDGLTINGNIINNIYDHGIIVDNSDNCTLTENSITDCKATINAGILLNNSSTGNIIGTSGHGNIISLPVSGSGNLRGVILASSLGAGSNAICFNTFNGGKHALWQEGGTSGTTTVVGNIIGNVTSPVLAGLYFDSGTLNVKSNTMTLGGSVNQGIFMNNACGTGSVIGGDLPEDGNNITFSGSGGAQYAIQTGGADEVKDFFIKNNVINGGQRGVQVDGPQTNGGGLMNISFNTISNTAYGAIISYNKKVFHIADNILTSNQRPIELFNPISIGISYNVINGATYDAINVAGFTGSGNSLNENNTISNAGGAGFRAQAGANNLYLQCNNISSCEMGILIESGCTGTHITNNNIYNNLWSGITSNSALLFVTGNTINNCWRGIEMSNTLTAHNNQFTNNVYGSAIFYTNHAHNVTDNWWNSTNGPAVWLNGSNVNTFEQLTQVEYIQANTYPNITFAPWLTSSTDNSEDCGFQPAAGTSFAPIYANADNSSTETEQYGSIQAANNLSALPFVRVKTGTYTEHPVINRSMTLTGLNVPVIDGAGTGTVVTLSANSATLQGFKVQNSGTSTDNAGIMLTAGGLSGVTGCTVTGNEITDNANGLGIIGGSGNFVTSNNIHHNDYYGALLIGTSGNTVLSNTISNQTLDGIALDNASAVGGPLALGSTGNFIKTNTISNISRDGIFIGENCNNNQITDVNNISAITKNGIHIWRPGGQIIQNNIITDANNGFRFLGSSGNTITGNTVSANDTGFVFVRSWQLGIWYPCTNNTIDHNNISSNTAFGMNASDNNGTTVNAASNWWGSANGPIHSTNPCGTGNAVTDYVTFSPWFYQVGMTSLNGMPVIAMTPINDISTITKTPVIFTTTVTYPDNLENYDPAVLTDARITSGTAFPAGSKVISLKYNGVESLPAEYSLAGETVVWLSEVLASPPAPLYLHDGLTPPIWEITVAGFDAPATYAITLDAVSYLGSAASCNTVLGTEPFSITFADLDAFTVTPGVTTACYTDALTFSVLINYPAIVNVNTAIKADASIVSDVLIPAGSRIDWNLNSGAASGTYTLLADATTIMLSAIVGGGAPFPLVGQNNLTDTWALRLISSSSPLTDIDLTIQPVAVLGTNYSYATGYLNDLNVITCGISGKIRYHNASNTPMNNVYVELWTPTGTSATYTSIVSDGAGNYSLSNVASGTYKVHFVTAKPVAGAINSTDAAQVNNWWISTPAIELVRFYAGDVRGASMGVPDNFIGAQDAQLIQGKFVQGASFDRNVDWTFWRAGESITDNPSWGTGEGQGFFYPEITVSPAAPNQSNINFYALATGDFNRSFIPNNAKAGTEDLELVYLQNFQVNASSEFELPVYTVNPVNVGAVSMILNFPADLVEVTNVSMNLGGQLDWSVKGDELRIGWNTQNPASLAGGAELLTLSLRTRAEFTEGNEIRFTLANSPLNELADNYYEVIPDAVLGINLIVSSSLGISDPGSMSYALSLANQPNPFKDYTMIAYALPFEGRVSLDVYSLLGTKVATLVDTRQVEGNYMIEFHTAALEPGVYIATLKFQGNGQTLTRSIKIVRN